MLITVGPIHIVPGSDCGGHVYPYTDCIVLWSIGYIILSTHETYYSDLIRPNALTEAVLG